MQEFGTFAKFYSAEDAQPLLQLLKQEHIPYKLLQERNQLEAVIIGDAMDPLFVVSIPVDQFQRANDLVKLSIVDSQFPLGSEINAKPATEAPERLQMQWIIFGYLLSVIM